jgi:RNA polymerase sigma-70 factor, ECF subfamily
LLPFYEPLQRRLLMILGDREMARDLTQEAFANAWRAWGKFDGREPRAWLFQIGTRLAINHLRRDMIWRRIRDQSHSDSAFIPDVDAELWDAIRDLRAIERSALLLHVVDGYTYVEIAGMLGVRTGTVGSLVSRARHRLRSRLGEQDA